MKEGKEISYPEGYLKTREELMAEVPPGKTAEEYIKEQELSYIVGMENIWQAAVRAGHPGAAFASLKELMARAVREVAKDLAAGARKPEEAQNDTVAPTTKALAQWDDEALKRVGGIQ